MAEQPLTLRQLNRATLARQMLLAREKATATQAVERLGGLQAQEARPPFIGLWTRVEGFRREDLLGALQRREVVRATLMRATLHLMTASDYAALRATLEPAMREALKALRGRDQGLDIGKLLPAARRLLKDRPLTFNELRPLLSEKFPKVNERALGYATRTQLPLVMVPTEDPWGFSSDAGFAAADTWLGGPIAKKPDPEALVLRHLGAFGPAAAADVQAWCGVKGMKDVLEGMRDELEVFKDERGRTLFDLPDAPRPDEDTPAPPRFLPEFDSLVLAHADRTRVVPDEHRRSLVTKNLRVRATFLWDGFVAGTWTVERRKGAATLRITPFERLPRGASKPLLEEGEGLLRFAEDAAASVKVELNPPAG